MLRHIVLLSTFFHAVVFGAFKRFGFGGLGKLDRAIVRRRSDDTSTAVVEDAATAPEVTEADAAHFEQHRDVVIAIAAYASFRYRTCARALEAFNTPMEQMFIRMFAPMIQGIFVNLEGRRRFGFNVENFLNNVAARVNTDCADGETEVVRSCIQRAHFLMNTNLGTAVVTFEAQFPFLTDGTDGLMQCALNEIPQVCADWYQELCVLD